MTSLLKYSVFKSAVISKKIIILVSVFMVLLIRPCATMMIDTSRKLVTPALYLC